MKSVLNRSIALAAALVIGTTAWAGTFDTVPTPRPYDAPQTSNRSANIGRFSVLLSALEVTGLDEAVAGEGPFTIFAPTDDAFVTLLAELGIGADQLLANPDLSSILLYHVVGGREGALQLLRARNVTTLQGDDLSVRLRRFAVYVNDSRLINPNVKAPNGLIHTIDKVLLP